MEYGYFERRLKSKDAELATLRAENERLRGLLKDAQKLGLTFHTGSAYISKAYIEKQSDLNSAIEEALK